MTSYRTDQLEAYRRLQPDKSERDAALHELLKSLGTPGTIFHVLEEINEQGEDLFTMLCDDCDVVSFEVPRRKPLFSAECVTRKPVAQCRKELGQGKARMRLDRTLTELEALLSE